MKTKIMHANYAEIVNGWGKSYITTIKPKLRSEALIFKCIHSTGLSVQIQVDTKIFKASFEKLGYILGKNF